MSLRLTILSPAGGSYSILVDADVRVGRGAHNDVRIPFPVISSNHLRIVRDGAGWGLIDVGSTNGTVLDGTRLRAGTVAPLRDGSRAEILDVRIEFGVVGRADEGFTLQESGTLLRKMLIDSVADASPDDRAFFETLEGPALGARAVVSDEIEEGWAGPGPHHALSIEGLPPRAFRVDREGDGFRITPGDAEVLLGDAPLAATGALLRSGAHIRVGAVRLVFFDPLEALLGDLDDGDEPSPVENDDVAAVDPTPEEPPGEDSRLTPVERLLLVLSLVVVVLSLIAIVVVLRA